MATAPTVQMRIVKNGGPTTKDTYKSYYSAGTSASEDWAKGELVCLVAGYIKRIGTFGTASTDSVNTDDLSAARYFITLEAHDASVYTHATSSYAAGDACEASQYVAVQEIMADTVLELQLCASSTTSPTIANLVTALATYDPCSLYKSASEIWGLDVDEGEDKGVFAVTDYASDYNWPTTITTTTGTKAVVQGRLINSILL